jgi:glycosyltransferase involved in cell wall biosynthesis
LAEAGAAGLPVVSTRSGGKSEIIEDNITGVLTDPGLAEPLAAACANLLADANRCAEMGRQARARVEKFYDVRRAAAELAAVFQAAAGRNSQ